MPGLVNCLLFIYIRTGLLGFLQKSTMRKIVMKIEVEKIQFNLIQLVEKITCNKC